MRCLWLLFLLAGQLPAATTYVVCVGVEKYDDARISALKYAAADASAVGAAFRASGVPPRNVTVLTSDATQAERRATRGNILKALSSLRERAAPGDKLVVFFAGHGLERDGQQYLLTTDAQANLLEDTALPARTINRALEGARASEVLFLIDACRNDPNQGRGDTDATLTEGLARGLRPVVVATAERPAVVATLLACDVGQRAWEDPEAGHGAFTVQLLRALSGQATAGGPVRLAALADYVTREVEAWATRANRQQRPRLMNPDARDMVVLVPPPEPLVSVAFVNHTLAQVVDLVSQQFGAGIVLGQGVDANLTVTGRLENQPLAVVLKVLVAAHGLQVRREGQVYVIEAKGAGPAPAVALPARPTAVRVDALGRTLVGDQPVMPLGLYDLLSTPEDLARIAAAGYTVVMPYRITKDLDQARAYLDAAQQAGLRVVFSLKDLYDGARDRPETIGPWRAADDMVRGLVTTFRDHPALLAWYVNDESPLTMHETLVQRQALVKSLDPNHPTYAVLYQVGEIAGYRDTADILGSDPYPAYVGPELAVVGRWTRQTTAAAPGGAPWQVLQAYNPNKPGEPGLKGRAPTLAELRNMAFQALAEGARGLLFFIYTALLRDPLGFDARWADMRQLAAELNQVAPFILTTERTPDCRLQPGDPNNVFARAWRLGDEILVLAANGSPQPGRLGWSLPGEPTVWLGQSTSLTSAGCDLGPEQAVAVRVKLGGPGPQAAGRPATWPTYLAAYQPPAGLTWASYRVRDKDGMPQVLIPAGEFLMGSPPDEEGREGDEGPQQRVMLSAYWMDLHEVTVAQYRRFCQATGRAVPDLPEWSKDDHPVVNVSWDDASAYAQWVGGSLPTEAQWERAARGGHENWPYVWGTRLGDGQTKANLGLGDPFEQTSPVGSFEPNGLGLFDMAGNVWEWCQDTYDSGWYGMMPAYNPVNRSDATAHAMRGSSWYLVKTNDFRVANRLGYDPSPQGTNIGFRCAGGADGPD